MFMGAFIVCALAFVKSFLSAFWPLPETADYTDFTDRALLHVSCGAEYFLVEMELTIRLPGVGADWG
jgi:hypothetical protein